MIRNQMSFKLFQIEKIKLNYWRFEIMISFINGFVFCKNKNLLITIKIKKIGLLNINSMKQFNLE